ncbi:transporter substrate-binding domain-containing protein [Chromobacterium haemolyticum]|nr:transporter substrate-binding domain-containing protein [Chromobacterium haemolyticum]
MAARAITIYTEDWPPITFQHNGVPDGMAVEVVREIQARMHDNSAIDVVPWARGYKELLTTPGVMLFTVGRNDTREKQMTLLGPIAISQTVLLARKGEAAGLLALGNGIYHRPVGAYRGSIFADAAIAAGFVEVDLAPTPQITAQKLLVGRYDMWSEGGFVVASVLKDIHQPAAGSGGSGASAGNAGVVSGVFPRHLGGGGEALADRVQRRQERREL